MQVRLQNLKIKRPFLIHIYTFMGKNVSILMLFTPNDTMKVTFLYAYTTVLILKSGLGLKIIPPASEV